MLDMKNTRNRILLVLSFILITVLTGFGVYRIVSGKSLGLRSHVNNSIFWATNPITRIVNGREITQANQGDFTNIVFLHHSTGKNLINQGNLRELLAQDGYPLWDHDYNESGLRRPDGRYERYNYHVPYDNTNPDGLVEIFRQPVQSLPLNTFSALLQHEVIIYKSCFRPANQISSDEQLQQYKDWYLEMRAVMASHPDRVFVIMTIPPLNPAETNPAQAARARTFANWLVSEEYLLGQRNIFVFDFFELLAEDVPSAPDYNMLKAEYRDGVDSHPNETANRTIGPIFAAFLKENLAQYRATFAQK